MLDMLIEVGGIPPASSSVEEEEPVKRKRIDLFKGFLPDLNTDKTNLLRQDEDAHKDYAPFIINKALSMHHDTIMYAAEMNRLHGLTKQMQYDFYIHGIRKRRRFGWQKKVKVENLDLIMRAYNYSERKALIALQLLSDAQIEIIKSRMDKGGKS